MKHEACDRNACDAAAAAALEVSLLKLRRAAADNRASPLIPTVIIPRRSFHWGSRCLPPRQESPRSQSSLGGLGSVPARAPRLRQDLETLSIQILPGKTRRSITAEARAAERRVSEPEKIPGSFERWREKKEKSAFFLDWRLSLQPSCFGKTALAGTCPMRLSVKVGGARSTG